MTSEAEIFSLIDHTHAAATELLEDAVVRDGLADHGLADHGGLSSHAGLMENQFQIPGLRLSRFLTYKFTGSETVANYSTNIQD